MCAGPYSQLLLGIPSSLDPGDAPLACAVGEEEGNGGSGCQEELDSRFAALNEAIENAVLDKHEMFRPGFTRLSLPYFLSEEKLDYILRAIEFVADKGALFLPLYRHNHRTGECAHTTRLTKFPERKWLTSFDLGSEPAPPPCGPSDAAGEQAMFACMFAAAEKEAARLLADNTKKLKKRGGGGGAAGAAAVAVAAQGGHEAVRWFLTNADFPMGLPMLSPQMGGSDLSLRRPLEGKICAACTNSLTDSLTG
jgi:hypothetical protein